MDISLSPYSPAPTEVVERAKALVPAIFRKAGVHHARGHELFLALVKRVEDKFAADQSIRQLIVDGMLEWEPVKPYGASISVVDGDGNSASFPTYASPSVVGATMPDSGPVPIDAIKVTVTDSLWAWSNKAETETSPAGGGDGSGDDGDLAAIDPDRDYVTATVARKNHVPDGLVLDHKKLTAFLELYGEEIRTKRPLGKNGKPRPNRLMVHLADWVRHQDKLSKWLNPSVDRDEAVWTVNAQNRKAEIDKKKANGK